jgi:hypothetical protein
MVSFINLTYHDGFDFLTSTIITSFMLISVETQLLRLLLGRSIGGGFTQRYQSHCKSDEEKRFVTKLNHDRFFFNFMIFVSMIDFSLFN